MILKSASPAAPVHRMVIRRLGTSERFGRHHRIRRNASKNTAGTPAAATSAIPMSFSDLETGVCLSVFLPRESQSQPQRQVTPPRHHCWLVFDSGDWNRGSLAWQSGQAAFGPENTISQMKNSAKASGTITVAIRVHLVNGLDGKYCLFMCVSVG